MTNDKLGSGRRVWVQVALVLATAALAGAAALALEPAALPYPDHDAAGGIRVAAPGGLALEPAQQGALARLAAQAGSGMDVRFNAASRVPRNLSATRPLTAPQSGTADAIARSFLHEHRDLWRLSEAELKEIVPSTIYTDRHNGVTHLSYTQSVGGIPVFTAVLGIAVSPRGEVLDVAGDVYPGLTPAAGSPLTPEQAARAAAGSVGVDWTPARLRNDGPTAILARGPFHADVRVERWIYPLLGDSRPAFRMLLDKNGLEWYDVLVDSRTGAILHRRNLYQFTGALSPSSPETNPAVPRGLVYVEHPLSTVRGSGDLPRRYPYTSDPTGFPRGFANSPLFGAGVTPTNDHDGNALNESIDQALLPFPDAASPLRSNALPVSTSPQSPLGWFTPIDDEFLTIGNNVDAKDDHAADDELSIGTRSSGGTNGDFSAAAHEFHNRYAQNEPYAAELPEMGASPERLAGAAPDLPAATLGLFYLTNWYHDFLYHLGFTEAAGNFQQDNFGRGGFGGDRLLADVQDGSGTDNANFGTPPDGQSPRMQMFLFSGPLRDGDFDADVVIHEFTHGVSNRLVGGASNVDCLGTPLVGESGSMGEGWGDWYAAAITDEPALGEYVTGNGADGIRRFAMNAGPADFTYGFLCTGPVSFPSLILCEVHDGGEFWSIVLWEMREAMINRHHNRAFPGGPAFPTFTASGTPDGNIRNAQGRTTDGSGDPAATDHATIENGTFDALFRVTDGMKFAPCNPTMIDMRDAILAADLALGGEHQDLIWRAFANRGVGAAATSTGGATPAIVEDFTVPQPVADCEVAGGPLAAPAFALGASADNEVTVTITPNGAAEYVIDRSTAGPGSPVDPMPFVEVGRTTGAPFTDSGLDGGVTYWYRVRALRNDACVSASEVHSIVPTGSPLACSAPPAFAGLLRVTDMGDCSRVRLEWTPGRSNCVGGPQVRYNVYRATTPFFVPGSVNRIATGVVGNSYEDTSGTLDELQYYVVRAEDSTAGGGGPSGGNEESNVVRRFGLVTSGLLVNQGFTDDVESGPDDERSAHFTSSGRTVPTISERGGFFRDSAPAPLTPRSPSTVWHTFDPDNQVFSPSDSTLYELRSDVMTITPESILTFHHTFATEAGFDGGVVEVATVLDETTGALSAFQDLGFLIFEGGYSGLLDALSEGLANSNPLFGRAAYTGGKLGPWQRSRAFLGALVPSGEPQARVVVRFLFGNDVANTGDPSPAGEWLPGWYIDDITIDQSCCPLSAAPSGLSAESAGDSTIALTWNSPGGTISEYEIYREAGADVLPFVFDVRVATVPGNQTSYSDTTVKGGVTYHYVVRAVPASGCPSASSNADSATATGPCLADPYFGGLAAVLADPGATCGLALSWRPGYANCPGTAVRYNLYRGTDPGFVPSPVNALALGLGGLTYTDQSALVHGTTYYYVVRAEDTTTDADGPANGGNEEGNLLRRSGSPDGALAPGSAFSDDLEPAAEPGYTVFNSRTAGGFSVTPDATARSPINSWVVLDDQPGAPDLTEKDDRLILPPQNLGPSSALSFWHNFDLARFPLGTPATANQSGGVLELSPDGSAWIDLGPYISAGGYNGVIDTGATNPLAGRAAWVGSSDGPLVAGRADAMKHVVVDLGAAIAEELGESEVAGARIRFRLGGTFQLLLGGIQGTGWGIDDLQITGVLQPGTCSANAGRVPVTLRVSKLGGSMIRLAWDPSCSSGAEDYGIYEGEIGDWYSHEEIDCSDDGADLAEDVDTSPGDRYYLVVPHNAADEGSYGSDSGGTERPVGTTTCNTAQIIAPCP